MWKLKHVDEPRPITKKMLDRFGKLTPLPNDRDPRTVKHLEAEHAAGQLRPVFYWADIYVKSENATYRLNGQNSHKFLSNGYTGPAIIVYEHYEGDTRQDATACHRTFDHRKSVRTGNDEVDIETGNLDHGMIRGHMRCAVAANSFRRWGVHYTGSQTDPTMRARTITKADLPMVTWLSGMLSGATRGKRGRINKVPVMAAMISTYLADAAEATEFWEAVRDGSTDDGTPARKLNELLIKAKIGSRKASVGSKVYGSDEIYDKCIEFWNIGRKKRLRLPDLETHLQQVNWRLGN